MDAKFHIASDDREPAHLCRLPVILVIIIAMACFLCHMPAGAVENLSSIGHEFVMVYTDGDQSRWDIHHSFLETGFNGSKFGLDWTVSIRRFQPSGDLRWGYFGNEGSAPVRSEDSDGGRFSGRIYLFEPHTGAAARVVFPRELAACRGEIRFRNDDRNEYAGSIEIRPVEYFKAEILHQSLYPFPEFSELYYAPYSDDDLIGPEGGKILWNIPANNTEFKLAASYPGKVEGTYTRSQTKLSTGLPKYGDFPMGTYTGQLYGGWDYDEGSISYVPISGWRNKIQYRQVKLATDSLTTHDGGLKFAHFGLIEGNGHIWSFYSSYRKYNLEINRGRAEGVAMGTIQAWPFLEGLYHFIGERRHFVLNGSIRWLQASIDREIWSKDWINLSGCLSYLRVKPDMSYATWRPEFMGIGIDDLRSGELDLQRADLIRLQIKPGIKWSHLIFSGNISQWVPIDSRKASDDIPREAGTGSGDEDDGPNLWGGFTASLVISAAF